MSTVSRRAGVLAAAVVLAVVSVLPAGASPPEASSPGGASSPVSGVGEASPPADEVIVQYRDDGAANPGRPFGMSPPGTPRTRLVEVPSGTTAERQAARLEDDPEVAYAEPNYPVEPYAEPLEDLQWGLHNTGQEILPGAEESQFGIPDVDVDAPEAWQTTTGGSGVVVAVIDTGVDIEHPDLSGAVWTNTAEADGTAGVDDDDNGYVDDVNGWDFLNADASVFDPPGGDPHGTYTAGAIAAPLNNLGVAGVAPGVTYMPLKAVGEGGSGNIGTVAEVVDAIHYAAANGADVINASWGVEEYSQTLRNAIDSAGLVVAAATGNESKSLDDDPVFPAAYDLEEVVSVTAVDNRGQVPSFANDGANTVDLAAPGRDIVTTGPRDAGGQAQYVAVDGTSLAAPFVAGIAALIVSEAPGLTASQITGRITGTTVPLSSLQNRTITGGLVNAAGALTAGACPPGEVPDAGFDDVSGSNIHARAIDCLAWWAVTGGVGGGDYAPGGRVSRGQMASFIRSVLAATDAAMPASPPDAFGDDDGTTHEPAINALAELGIVAGAGGGGYEPGEQVTRAQMASFLIASVEWLTGGTVGASGDFFTDDDGSLHEPAINAARSIGLAQGTGPTTYGPGGPVSRAQMASFLTGLLDHFVQLGRATPPAGP